MNRKEYLAKYYQDNKERLNSLNRAWVKANRQRRNEIALKSYHKRKEEK